MPDLAVVFRSSGALLSALFGLSALRAQVPAVRGQSSSLEGANASVAGWFRV